MGRTKKGEEKPKEAASLMVSVEDFIRTRDSVRLLRLFLYFSSRFVLTHDAMINTAHQRLRIYPPTLTFVSIPYHPYTYCNVSLLYVVQFTATAAAHYCWLLAGTAIATGHRTHHQAYQQPRLCRM